MMGMALLFLKVFEKNILNLLLCSNNTMSKMGPLFFASLRDRPSGYLNMLLTVVAAGLRKWLDIYSGVLMVRVTIAYVVTHHCLNHLLSLIVELAGHPITSQLGTM